MIEVLQQIVNGASLGSTYALLALGLAIVFSILHLINFAHGELITIPAYAMYGMYLLGAPWFLYAPAAVVAAVAAALLMERFAFRPVRSASPSTMLLTSLGLSIIIQGLFQTVISPRERGLPQPNWLLSSVDVAGLRLQVHEILTLTVTTLALIGLVQLLRRTHIGLAMRAAAHDFDATRLMGIRAGRVIATAFAISGLLAGMASVLILARRGSVHPLMGLAPVLKAFIATVLGGFGNLWGAALGGFMIGMVEVGLRAGLPDGLVGFADGFLFLFIGVVLFFRPSGLFAVKEVTRV